MMQYFESTGNTG